MLRKWIKKHLPNKKTISSYPSLGKLGRYLSQHPSLWYLNSYSIARGVAIGLFVAFIPLPVQMLMAAFLAMIFRANVPVAIVMTWVSNPFTFFPFNYFIYFIGAWILDEKIKIPASQEVAWDFDNLYTIKTSFISWISQFGKAYFVGLPIIAISLAVMGYYAVIIFWKIRKNNKNTRNAH